MCAPWVPQSRWWTRYCGSTRAAAASDHRLRVIGVTWNDEASAQAALVLEALTDAGFDNVVPIRFLEAIETLAQAIAPVIGYEQTAVCILDHDWTTVVMVDTHDGETQTAIKHVRGGFDGLTRWLTGMFERDGWQPGGVVVVGADSDIDGLSWQLEKTLPVPVFVQSMAQVTIARGAALSAARSTEFTDEQLVEHIREPDPRSRAEAAVVLLGSRDRAGGRRHHLRRLGITRGGDSRWPGQRGRRAEARHAPAHTANRRGGHGRRAASGGPAAQAGGTAGQAACRGTGFGAQRSGRASRALAANDSRMAVADSPT